MRLENDAEPGPMESGKIPDWSAETFRALLLELTSLDTRARGNGPHDMSGNEAYRQFVKLRDEAARRMNEKDAALVLEYCTELTDDTYRHIKQAERALKDRNAKP